METTATILHADLDAFYASVEQLLDPTLRGKPIAVGGGVVLAEAFGISGGMSGRRARKLCPRMVELRGRTDRRATTSRSRTKPADGSGSIVPAMASMKTPAPHQWFLHGIFG
jgi:nucleotidyltransferase/DNA polymerase involved in DNA repair